MSDRPRARVESSPARSPRHRRARAVRDAALQPLEARQLMAAQPVISEFMAKNGVTLTDGFGENNDWIEISNQGDASIDLAGWHLTDSGNLSKWTFPTFTLAAGQARVVFASSRDTTDPAGNLHTNFSLSQDGEKLALTRPDLSIASRYSADGSNYPTQLSDVSYGIGTIYDNTVLVGPRAPSRAIVPTNGTLDAGQWTAIGFDDGAWLSGAGGVGFDTGGYEDNTLPPAIVGQWSADNLAASLANGAVVNSWTDSVRGATAYRTGSPTYATNAINGHSVIHFNPADGSDLLRVPAATNPMAGNEDFTVVVVFRATAGIGSSGGQWTANAGLVDASVAGTTNDWGIALSGTSGGRVGAGIGAPDTTVYSATGKVNNAAHVAVFTRDDGKLSLFVDGGDPVTATGSVTARGLADMVFGGLQTGANFFTGDLAEVRVYDGAMSPALAYAASSALGTTYGFAVTAPTDTLGATLSGDWSADALNAAANNAAITSWASSVGNATATASGSPRLQKSQLNGHSVVRFTPADGNDQFRVPAGSNPLSNAAAFSVAVVFRTSSVGVGDSLNWYSNTGIVDAEQGGVTNDWGLAIDSTGRLGAGIGNPDTTLYSNTGFADGQAHVAVYSKSGDTLMLSIDGGTPYAVAAPAANRNSADLVFGSIQTNLNYYHGDLAEIQTYSGALDEDAAHALAGTLANKYGIVLAPDRYDPLIGIQLQSQMFNAATTALVRVPFTVDGDPSRFDKLTLAMQYDDGFVAYLNGVEVARRNASGAITYTSVADGRRLDNDALTVQQIDLSAFTNLLVGNGGANVLAIRGLNSGLADPDFLLVPQLIASRSSVGVSYMSAPTPGAANGAGYAGFVPDLAFGTPHGLYNAAFNLTVSTATPGVTIVYTLDGSEPSPTNGTVVAPASAAALNSFTMNVNRSTTLRAVGFKNTYLPSRTVTQTYVFTSSVLTQTNVAPPGAHWDTEVDPEIVNATQTFSVAQALAAVPTMSLVLPDEDIFGATGIYANPQQSGRQWERETSVEYFDPNDASLQFQLDAGLRITGGSGRDPNRPKHGLRLFFRTEYGESKLDAPLFGANQASSFDHLNLRAINNNSWANEPGAYNDLLRDQFARDLSGAVNGFTANGKFVQLYINGLYWGLYNLIEDPDEQWAADNFGGDKSEYDLLEPDGNGGMEVNNGTADAYNNVLDTVDAAFSSGNVIDNAEYAAITQILDVDNLAGYMLATLYRGDRDAPVAIFDSVSPRNFFAFHRNVPGGKVFFQTWDGELSMDDVNFDRTEASGNLGPARLFNRLRTNGEFQQLVTDRIYKLFFNGGPLQVGAGVNKPQAIYDALVAQINVAIVGESARWGDAKRAAPYTRDADWLNSVNWIRNTFLAQRSAVALGLFTADFPAAGRLPASFLINGQPSRGGVVASNATLTLLNQNATTTGDVLYYTLDGTDPRLPGGGIASTALVYNGAGILITTTRTVTVRTLNGGVWTAADRVNLVVAPNGLRVTEIAYQPTVPPGGTFTAGDYEFIELQNTGTAALDIGGTAFTLGITYTFPVGTVLQAGEYVVVAKSIAAFQQRYGTGPRVAGAYSGSLANEGEPLLLVDAAGLTIQSFAYAPSWYAVTAGLGHSLAIRDALADKSVWNTAAGWRPSQVVGGSPGGLDVDVAPAATVTAITPNPRNTVVATITIAFSEPVTGFDLAHLSLTRDTGANLLTASQTLTTADGGKTWTLGNLGGLTGVDGTYAITVIAAGIVDLTGNALPAGTSTTFTVDRTAPTFTSGTLLLDGTRPKLRFTFSETLIASGATPVLTVTRNSDGAPLTVGGQTIAGNAITFDLPTAIGDGNYTATLGTPGVRDAAGNLATAAAQSFFFLAGDVNHDGAVGFDDLLAVAQNYGGSGKVFSQGDGNYDGVVNFDDLLILAQQYGKSIPPAAGKLVASSASTPGGVPAKGKGRVASDVLA